MITVSVTVNVMQMEHAIGLPLPAYATPGSAGMDLVAACPEDQPILLRPGQRGLVPTGLVLQLPPGFEGQVRPRSGLALKQGVTVLNAPGTIDSDYRGELQVLLINLGQEIVILSRGERIAQLVISAVSHIVMTTVEALNETKRGAGGFGSTGRSTALNKNRGPKT